MAIVLGKGRRPRACPFGAKTAGALDRWMHLRARDPRAATTDACGWECGGRWARRGSGH